MHLDFEIFNLLFIVDIINNEILALDIWEQC